MSNPFQASVADIYKASELMVQAQFMAKTGEHADKIKPLFDEAQTLVERALKTGKSIRDSRAAQLFLESNSAIRNVYKQHKELVAAYVTAFEENETTQ